MSETKEPHVAGAPPDDTPAAVHTDPAPETDAPVQTEPEVKRKRGRPRKNPAPENESGNEAKDENTPQPNFVMSGDQRVLSIDSRRTVETDADKAKNNLLDLMESLRSKRILTGMIQGVEGNPDSEPRAVVYRGEFKILIPASLCIERPTDFRGMKPNDVLKYQITKRLGAEIEYIVKGIDPESGVVVASRMDAMAIRRRQFYYGKDRDGNNLIYEGCIAEARIICVIRTGAFIELFGQECFVPLQELGYQRMVDAMRHFAPGQRILVKVLRLDRTDPEHIKIELSAKQVSANPYEKVMQKHAVGNHYVGTVSVIHLGGIWVSLDSGLDCLCNFPVQGRPLPGARVTVKLMHINEENGKLFGEIVYSSQVQ